MARPKKSAEGSSITFTTTNQSSPVRTFSAETHGSEYEKIADEFAATHEHSILNKEVS